MHRGRLLFTPHLLCQYPCLTHYVRFVTLGAYEQNGSYGYLFSYMARAL